MSNSSSENFNQKYIYPASYSQQGIWFVSELEKESKVFNSPIVINIKGLVKNEVLESTLSKIVDRHEILRTNFIEREGKVFQVIDSVRKNNLNITTLKNIPLVLQEDKINFMVNQEVNWIFDLEKSSLIKFRLIVLEDNKSVLIINMHHIITDNISSIIFVNELLRIYNNMLNDEEIIMDDLTFQYLDFSEWQRISVEKGYFSEQLVYWTKKLPSTLKPLLLETDYNRTKNKTYNGSSVKFKLDEKKSIEVERYCKENKITNFTFFLSLFKVLLYKYTSENDIAIGTPMSSRNKKEFENTMGLFVNSVVIYNKLDGSKLFSDFVQEMQNTVLSSFDNQDIPFEKVVETINPERNQSQSVFFETAFTFLNQEHKGFFKNKALEINLMEFNSVTTKYELSLDVVKKSNLIDFDFVYNTDLFKEDSIKSIGKHYINILNYVLESDENTINEINILNVEEMKEILEWGNLKF